MVDRRCGEDVLEAGFWVETVQGLFAGSHAGGGQAAILYTLIQTATFLVISSLPSSVNRQTLDRRERL